MLTKEQLAALFDVIYAAHDVWVPLRRAVLDHIREQEAELDAALESARFRDQDLAKECGMRKEAEAERDALRCKLDGLVKAAEPFAHPDLSKIMSNNVQGDESPVFQRNSALLTIGDFSKLQDALAAAQDTPTTRTDTEKE